MTFTDYLNLVLDCLSHPDASAILTVTLRRLAVIIANRQDGPELLEGLLDAYYGARSDLRYREQLALVMRGKN